MFGKLLEIAAERLNSQVGKRCLPAILTSCDEISFGFRRDAAG